MQQIEIEQELFTRCLDLPEAERDALLEQECGDDKQLRKRLERLLQAHARALLDQSKISPASIIENYKEEIDGFRILRVLGEGGMGIVLLAEQRNDAIRRRVAIKIIKPGMDTHEVLARFEFEKRALSLMSHPNIARIFSAGQTRSGRPYFVLEYIPGLPIDRYCEIQKLRLHDRLTLLLKACHAVQHAHQRGIIHRDIKPANILVSEKDGKPLVKVIDFGIAKAIYDQPMDMSLHTKVGSMIGTPEYVSPEQADPFNYDVDTRADVYSLGAVLYRLVTGMTPLDLKRRNGYTDIRRALQESNPLLPSSRIRKTGLEELTPNQFGFDTRHSHIRALKRDLDWICLKSLQKNRNLRYATPADLANDIRNYLDKKPVTAAPPSLLNDFSKFLKRNKLASAFTATLFTLISGFAIHSYQQYQSILEERARANIEAERALAMQSFLQNSFELANPDLGVSSDISVRDLLRQTTNRIHVELSGQPLMQAKMLLSAAEFHNGLGLYKEAAVMRLEAADTLAELKGPSDIEALHAYAQHSHSLIRSGDHEAAQQILQKIVPALQAHAGTLHEYTLQARGYQCALLQEQWRYEEASHCLQELMLAMESAGLTETMPYVEALKVYSLTLHNLTSDHDTANSMLAKAANILHTIKGEHHYLMRDINSKRIAILHAAGNIAAAESIARQELRTLREVYGEPHPMVAQGMVSLATILASQRQGDTAIDFIQQAHAMMADTQGNEHPDTVGILYSLMVTQIFFSQYTDAIANGRKVVALQELLYGALDSRIAATYSELAIAFFRNGQLDEALREKQNAVNILTEINGPLDKTTLMNRAGYGIMMARRNMEEAAPIMRDAYRQLREGLDADDHRVRRIYSGIERAYTEQGLSLPAWLETPPAN